MKNPKKLKRLLLLGQKFGLDVPVVIEGTSGTAGKDGRDGIGLPGKDGRDGKDGMDGKDGVSVSLEEVIKEIQPQILARIPHGGGNMNRDIKINSSVITKYGDLNFIGSIVGVPNTTTRYTDVYFSGDGGGTPAGADTQVQFNDAGSFGASTGLTFNKNTSVFSIGGNQRFNGFGNYGNFTLKPTDTTANDYGADLTISGGTPTFNDSNVGGSLTLSGGDGMTGGSTASPGGAVTVKGGDAFSGNANGAAALVVGGAANGTGTAGTAEVRGGPPENGNGGGVVLQGSACVADGFSSGGVTISGGNSTTGDSSGGNITINGGNGHGNADGGDIQILSGTGGALANGGTLTFQSGNGGGTSGNGGLIQFGAGDAVGGNFDGGDIFLYTGTKSGSGAEGRIRMQSSPSATFGVLDFSSIATTAKTFTFPNTTGTVALLGNNLGSFAATTSSQLSGVLSDETGSGAAVFGTSPALTTPAFTGNPTGTVTSGTWTPTVTNSTNTDTAVTTTTGSYLRVGNQVSGHFRFTADPTLAATITSFEFALPVASNFANAEDLGGTAVCGNIASMSAEATAQTTNDTGIVSWRSSDVTSQTWSVSFSYRII